MVLYKPRFHCLPTELDVSHNNEGGILAQKGSKSAIVQLKQEEALFSQAAIPR